MNMPASRHFLILAALGLSLMVAWPAAAQEDANRPATPDDADLLSGPDRTDPLPSDLEDVGVDERLNHQVPLDLKFKDHEGRQVQLADYFDGERPVILTLNYYRCPMLCGLQLNGMLEGLKELDWTAGEEYRILTVSFDPLETPQLAALKRQNYLAEYGRAPAAGGWSFLTGSKKNIDALLEATGFRIQFNKKTNEWMHAAALMICTPDGRLSRYLYGVMYEPKTLRLSLVEASDGKIGSPVDQILLFCYHYEDGEYTLAAMNVVRAGGTLTLIIVAGVLIAFWRRELRHRKQQENAAA